MKWLKGLGWGAVVLLLTAGPLQARPGDEAQSLVRETTDEVLSRLEARREALRKDPGQLDALIEDVVLPHFDFEAMSRLVLARYWRRANPDQRRRFVEEFRNLLVRTYGTALLEYTGQTIEYPPLHAREGDRRVNVPTRVVPQEGGPAIPIVYRLYRKGGEWKVYDISVDGASLLLNYRNSYGRLVRREGMEALIERMARKNARKAS